MTNTRTGDALSGDSEGDLADWFANVVEVDGVTEVADGPERSATAPGSATPLPSPKSGRVTWIGLQRQLHRSLGHWVRERYGDLPSWALLLQLFLAAGWARAALANGINEGWWSGDVVLEVVAAGSGSRPGVYDPVIVGLVEPMPALTAVVVLLLEVLVVALLVASRRVGVGLAVGGFLNLQFMLAGAVNPSVFYLVASLGLGSWLLETSGSDATVSRLVRFGRIAGVAVTVALLPSVGTIHPSSVIEDPALVLIFLCGLALVALWRVQRRLEPGTDGSLATDRPEPTSGRDGAEWLASLLWPAIWLAIAALILVIGFALAGGDSGDSDDSDASGAGEASAVTTVERIGGPAGGPIGTSESPYPRGNEVSIFYDDPVSGAERVWRLEVLEASVGSSTGPSSTEGQRPVLVRLRLSNAVGRGSARTDELRFGLVGPSGRVYRRGGSTCRDVEVDVVAEFVLPVAEAAEVWRCWSVPTDDSAPMLLAVRAEAVNGTAYLALE